MDETAYTRFDWLPGFHRKPSWRWIRAGILAPTRRRLDPRLDDEWVACARRFRRTGSRWSTNEKEKHSAMSAALALWSEVASVRRSMLEAYLLTTVPFERIAVICDLDPMIVEAFHSLFFDVRPRLAATDWLLRHAVGWRPTFDPGVPDQGHIWKYVALAGGDIALEVMIAVMANTPLPDWIMNAFPDPAVDAARLRLLAKLFISTLTAKTPQERTAIDTIRKRLRTLEAVEAEETEGDRMLVATESFFAAAPNRPRSSVITLDDEARSTGDGLLANSTDQRATSPRRRRSTVTLVDDAVSTADERPFAAEMLNVPVGRLEPNHSWRSFNAEDPDTADGIDVDRERCRVFVAPS